MRFKQVGSLQGFSGFYRRLLSIGLGLIAWVAIAAPGPMALLEETSHTLLAEVQAQQANISHDRSTLFGLVDRILMPHVDVDNMARLVVGGDVWRSASPAQKAAFIHDFSRLIIRTYASALSSIGEHRIKFYPLREEVAQQRRVLIRSTVAQPSGPPVAVYYRMLRQGNTWKVYDFSVDGVSMVQSYRAQFDSVLAQKGFAVLLSQIRAHNAAQS